MPVLALSTTLPPVQKLVDPPAVIVAVGEVFAVTLVPAEVVEQPLLVTTTVYVPVVVAAYVEAVAPLRFVPLRRHW